MLPEIFQYSFMTRGLAAGLIVALIAPLVGVFLVLRRHSLIADALSHVSLAGIALGLIAGINPALAALIATGLASLGIERLRSSRRFYNESILALFLSGSLALAVILLSFAHGFNTNLFNYLFGSILTVSAADLRLMAILAAAVGVVMAFIIRELVFIAFDEEAARVAGLPVKAINFVFILLAATTVSLAIPVVGVMLIGALLVIPAVSALQLRQDFFRTLLWAEAFSVFSVVVGIVSAFYLDLAAGGTIVMVALLIFAVVLIVKKIKFS